VTIHLADANVLIAFAVTDHVHHRDAIRWLESQGGQVATCPITQGTLLRFLLREGLSAADATAALDQIVAQTWHVFWPDEIAYQSSTLAGVIGHRQVTDAYLVHLARHFGGALVTLDRGLVALHGGPDVVLIEA